MGFLRKLVVGTIFTVVYYIVAGAIVNATTPARTFDNLNPSSPWTFLLWLGWIPLAFVVLDTIADSIGTRTELYTLMSGQDAALATRGEYRGGHPFLPRARFVYLVLCGTLEQPELRIFAATTGTSPEKPDAKDPKIDGGYDLTRCRAPHGQREPSAG
jgi:hypothetical protein